MLADLSASQWGMVTTAQAAERGVGRLVLSRLARAGHLVRLLHGVYRDAGAPSDEFESLRAAWLSTDPALTADQRLGDLPRGVIVMGESAASLHGIGDLPADVHRFSSAVRRQSQRREVRYRKRDLDLVDLTIVHGLPATTMERTLADLVEARTDLTLVADALRDAVHARHLDLDRLRELLGPLSARNGFRSGDGAALLDHLRALAGIDTAGLAREIVASKELSMHVAANALARLNTTDTARAFDTPAFRQAVQAMDDALERIIEPSLARAAEELSASIVNSPATKEMQANIARIAQKIVEDLPTQQVLGAFAEKYAAALEKVAVPPADVGRTLDVIAAAGISGTTVHGR